MALSVLRANSNLLPAGIDEVGLEKTEDGSWRGYCAHQRGEGTQHFEFPGGRNPESWLAFKLERDHAFATMAASEAARRLFGSFRTSEA
jgi:hypothetical protein